MELHKLNTTELKGLDVAKLRETENELRKQLVDIRMDIYTAKSTSAAKVKGLRRSLARLLTVRGEIIRKNPPAPKAPKAEKPVKAAAAKPAKAAKAAAPAEKPAKAKAKAAAPAKAKTKTATKK